MQHIVPLADLNTRHSQYRVSGDQVKVESGHEKVMQILMPGEIGVLKTGSPAYRYRIARQEQSPVTGASVMADFLI